MLLGSQSKLKIAFQEQKLLMLKYDVTNRIFDWGVISTI